MSFKWGQVSTVTPLTVKLDGSSNALPVIQSLVDPSSLTVGDMVRVELAQGGRVVVYGLPGGDGVPFAMAAGSVLATVTSNSYRDVWYNNFSVTFPAGRFTEPPIVTLGGMPQSSGVGTAGFTGPQNSTSAFSCRVIQFSDWSGSKDVGIYWQAIQMSEGNASG